MVLQSYLHGIVFHATNNNWSHEIFHGGYFMRPIALCVTVGAFQRTALFSTSGGPFLVVSVPIFSSEYVVFRIWQKKGIASRDSGPFLSRPPFLDGSAPRRRYMERLDARQVAYPLASPERKMTLSVFTANMHFSMRKCIFRA